MHFCTLTSLLSNRFAGKTYALIFKIKGMLPQKENLSRYTRCHRIPKFKSGKKLGDRPFSSHRLGNWGQKRLSKESRLVQLFLVKPGQEARLHLEPKVPSEWDKAGVRGRQQESGKVLLRLRRPGNPLATGPLPTLRKTIAKIPAPISPPLPSYSRDTVNPSPSSSR